MYPTWHHHKRGQSLQQVRYGTVLEQLDIITNENTVNSKYGTVRYGTVIPYLHKQESNATQPNKQPATEYKTTQPNLPTNKKPTIINQRILH
jgi:hypothetical protein